MANGEGPFAFRRSRASVLAVGLVFVACGPTAATLDLDGGESATTPSRDGGPDALVRPAWPSPVDAGADDEAPQGFPASLDACLRACERRLPEGVSKLRPVFACAEQRCHDACVAFTTGDASDAADGAAPPVCADVGDGPGRFTWFDGPCDACLAAECCPLVTTCMGDTSCDALNQCEDACYAPAPSADR